MPQSGKLGEWLLIAVVMPWFEEPQSRRLSYSVWCLIQAAIV